MHQENEVLRCVSQGGLDAKKEKIVDEQIHFSKKFGRLRDVCVSVFIATSNRDWNPPANFPQETDDRIIRIVRPGTIAKRARKALAKKSAELSSAATLYASFCESCHKQNGEGVPGSFPSLRTSSRLRGDVNTLLKFIMKGSLSASGEGMPAFGFMTDVQLAEVVSYVRQNFAGEQSSVSPQEVKQSRGN